MIRPLRKRHLQIWSTLLVLIPAGIIMAWLSIKKPVHNNVLQPASEQALPKVILSVEKESYTVRLRSNESGARQLEWVNKDVLRVPSAVIYKTSPNPSQGGTYGKFSAEHAELIGRIEARGTYHFPLKEDSSNLPPQFILYDFIHEKIIDSVKF
jgi:hypothetical protein